MKKLQHKNKKNSFRIVSWGKRQTFKIDNIFHDYKRKELNDIFFRKFKKSRELN